ncbi:MAG: hypothetical protein RR557_09370 [Bacilli bacterium]
MKIKKRALDVGSATTENLIDNTLLSTADSVLEEFIKAFPFVSAFKGVYQGFYQYQLSKRTQQFLYYIDACELESPKKINEIFKDKSNLEMGMEIMNAIELSYLEKHARMIARATILYDAKEISRSEFLKYMHIIPKLTSYLLDQIKECYERNKLELTNPRHGLKDATDEDLTLELESYGFVQIITHPFGGKEYKATGFLLNFYENIFQSEHD